MPKGIYQHNPRPQTRGENNVNWKGDEVTYFGLHDWIKKNFKKTGICENCEEKKKTEWANKSGKYLRDRSDWEELCRKCHMIKDGRINQKHYLKGHPNYYHGKQINA